VLEESHDVAGIKHMALAMEIQLASGEIALMAERWSRLHHSHRMGVCPIGAQIRTTLGKG